MPQVILAVDQGTTGSTALLIDSKARVLAKGYRELSQHYPKPGWVAHDPNEILAVTRIAVRQALERARLPASRVSAIGITNQRETTIVWNRRTGRPVADAIVWQCRRTAEMCAALVRKGYASDVRRRTGLVIDAYFSATKIRWLLDHVRESEKRARAGELAFGTVDSWLLWNLTGGRVHATDATNASRTLLYNIRMRVWDPILLKRFGVPSALLPEVRNSRADFGRTAGGALGLPEGIPILGIAGDQQAAMVGHGCLRPGTAKNTYGTGCFLLQHTGKRAPISRAGLVTTLIHDDPEPSYALEGSVFIAGAAIQWLRDGLRLIANAAETEAIARGVKDTGGVYVVPAFVGLGAPYWDMDARGAVVGITRGTTREVLVSATLESLAYQTSDVVDAMQQDSGLRLRELRVDGGAAQNNWLMQFQADILNIPVLRPRLIENTARGAGFLAGLELGLWKRDTIEAMAAHPEKRFEPRMPSAARERLYAGWREAVSRTRSQKS